MEINTSQKVIKIVHINQCTLYIVIDVCFLSFVSFCVKPSKIHENYPTCFYLHSDMILMKKICHQIL